MDLGTSACKFLLVDETGKVCNQVSREYPLSMPHTGWSEQDPSSWWQACLDGIPALLEGYATTLHYAPCHTDARTGFRVLVALPKGTNTARADVVRLRSILIRLRPRGRLLISPSSCWKSRRVNRQL